MKSHNIALKRLKIVTEILILMFVCLCTTSYATDINLGSEENTENLPYIEMKVKSKSVDGTTQVLVEAWGSKFTNLEGLEIVFTYDNTKLTPSNIADNSEITNLESIKYEKTPTQSTAQDAFYKASKDVLSNSFAFKNEYADKLGIDLFRYLAPYEKNEAMQFVISRKDYENEISATDPVLLGTFSFKQTKNTTLDETEFTTKRIKIYCDDGLTENDYSWYEKEDANGDDCTEIVEFIYAKYGSISGTIETGYYNQTQYVNIGKNIANVKIYNASDVSSIDWTLVGNQYKNNRINIQPIITSSYKTYCRPDVSQTPTIEPVFNITTAEEDLGKFEITTIPYGEYVVVVDKLDYGDYIITNVVVDSTYSDIDLGNIQLEVGDFNKDGKIDRTDRTIFLGLIANMTNIENDLGIVGFDLDDNGKYDRTDRTIMLRVIASSLNKTIKSVLSMEK